MDFEHSSRVRDLIERLNHFMERRVYRAEAVHDEQIEASKDPHFDPPIIGQLQSEARAEGLWNLFMGDARYGPGLGVLDYAPLCEIMGRGAIAPRVFNCSAPDTGNMEILAEYGSDRQKEQYLVPLLNAEIHSCFAMTEPEVAGSDPTLLRTRAVRAGDEYVIDGHKWFATGAIGAAFAIVMAVTDPDAPGHKRASMILVPAGTPGYHIVRPIATMGHVGGTGHCEVRFENCRVPTANLLGPEHQGFAIAQARLGPGRIHHCMRCIGAAERALEIMCQRANRRLAHGGPLAEKGIIRDWIARSRIEIDQARLLVLHAAWKMDAHGQKEARREIAGIKVAAVGVLLNVLDRAMQTCGALGLSDDLPLARMWRDGRTLRVADGPDEVHHMVIARHELRRWETTIDPALERALRKQK